MSVVVPEPPINVFTYVATWLPKSETFVYEQLRFQRQTQVTVIAGTVTHESPQTAYEPVLELGYAQSLTLRHFSYAPRLTSLIHKLRPRVLHAHFGNNGAYLSPICEKAGLPLVVTFHGHDVGGLMPENRYSPRYFRYQRLSPQLFDGARLLLCSSSELRARLLEFGAPEKKLIVHQLGVDTEQLRRIPREFSAIPSRIVMVGRLVEKKGTIYGLRAFARLRREVPKATLCIIGDGPLRPSLESAASALNLGDSVQFTGALDHQETLARMANADVLLAPSVTTKAGDRESGMIVIKEAGALGLATVATRHGGIPELIVEGQTGYLVAERDEDALVERLEALLSDCSHCRAMGAAAQAHVLNSFDSRVRASVFESHLVRAATS